MMFVKEARTGDLIRVDRMDDLANPLATTVLGRRQAGEEEQDAVEFAKDSLVFPSGESLPKCWLDESFQLTRRRERREPA